MRTYSLLYLLWKAWIAANNRLITCEGVVVV